MLRRRPMMEQVASVAEAMRKTFEAYTEALSAVVKALEKLPTQGGDAHRRVVEQWLDLACMSKESAVAAINQGFDLWERECRRLVGAPHAAGSASISGTMIDAWAERWKRTLDAFAPAGPRDEPWAEQARRQAELVQQSLLDSLHAWQRLWQSPQRTP
jgi:hypothetical protein